MGNWKLGSEIEKKKEWRVIDQMKRESIARRKLRGEMRSEIWQIYSKGSGFLVVFDEEEEEDWSSSWFGGNERDKFAFNFLF